jgi:hypothetical protein
VVVGVKNAIAAFNLLEAPGGREITLSHAR